MDTLGTFVGSIGTVTTRVYGDPRQRGYNQAGSVMLAQVDRFSQTSAMSRGRWRQAPKAAAAAGVSAGR